MNTTAATVVSQRLTHWFPGDRLEIDDDFGTQSWVLVNPSTGEGIRRHALNGSAEIGCIIGTEMPEDEHSSPGPKVIWNTIVRGGKLIYTTPDHRPWGGSGRYNSPIGHITSLRRNGQIIF